MECSAFVSLLILSVNLVVKAAVHIMKKRIKKDKAVRVDKRLEEEYDETIKNAI